MNVEKPLKKILIMGLDNVGKTSILLSLQEDSNIMSFCKLKPTKRINIVNIKELSNNVHVWDFGGQEKYREDYLKNLSDHLAESEKIIFVIDVQNEKQYDNALEYLKKIIDKILEEQNTLSVSIFLHKFDGGLEKKKPELVQKKIPLLKEKITQLIPKKINYEIFKTTIYTVFDKKEY